MSHFHLLSSDEIWYYHFGHALTVHMIHQMVHTKLLKLGLETDKAPVTVPAGVVFGSTIESDNEEDCDCELRRTPGFEYEDFILYSR